MLAFEEAEQLFFEIRGFLLSCGGIYQTISHETERNLLECISLGQYCVRRDETGALIHALLYWKVWKKDIDDILDGCKPSDYYNGDTLVIIEHGSKSGHLRDIIKELRTIAGDKITGVLWNHKGEGFKMFLKQKGRGA